MRRRRHYCGPATGLMMVWMLKGADRSAYDNSKFWQSRMANWRHMRTDIDGATRWANGTFQRGVNRWTGWNLYQPDDSPSGDAVKSYLRFMIGANGMPIAGDTVEFRNRAHYNRHPQGQTIGHWITAFRYTENGNWSKWGDPSTSLWPGVRPAFGRWTRPFTNTFLQSNGVVW